VGLIVDTSVLIDAERKKKTLAEVLTALPDSGEVAVSALSLSELAEGIVRARDAASRLSRQIFLDWLQDGVVVIPLESELAIAAGRLNGELRRRGTTIGLADVIIAATALDLGYGVATLNAKHFKYVPGLEVVEL
jgi:predicted nucleic acid-binding protein